MASRIVVCDARPLIALGRIDRLDILVSLLSEVQVPREVFSECVRRPEFEDAQRIQAAVASGALHLCEAAPIRIDGLGAV